MTKSIGIIGSGIMGAGIAQIAAQAGYSITMVDLTEAQLSAAVARIKTALERSVSRGFITDEIMNTALSNITTSPSLSSVADCDLIIENIWEELEAKGDLLKQLEDLVPPTTILASNTSTIPITELGATVQHPDRVVGMHFFNPPHKVRLLEIIRADQTSEQVIEAVREIGVRMNRELVVVNDSPGFASSRLGIALGMEAIRMVEQGVAVPEDIDAAMVHGYRHPIGPLRLGDLVGLDVRLSVGDYLCRELGEEQFRPPALLRQMVADGKLGRKSGEGFYIWND